MAIRGSCRVYNKLPDAAASTIDGVGIRSFHRHNANTILIYPRLPNGAHAAYVAIDDVCLTVTDGDDACPVRVRVQIQPDLGNGNISIAYTLDAGSGSVPKEICVRVHVCGALLVDVRVARSAFNGRVGGRLRAQHTLFTNQDGFMAAAICQTGARIAFSDCWGTGVNNFGCCVNVFALPDFQFIGKLGKKGNGPTELNHPHGLCFTDAGTLLIADCENNRVQHWTLDGEWIASYFVEKPYCVAVHGDTVVAGGDSRNGTRVFSLSCGAEVSKWSSEGCMTAVAFVDAVSLVVAKLAGETVGLYTLEGVLKVQLAVGLLSVGLAVCADGYLLVSDLISQRRVHVFSTDGNELITSPFASYLFKLGHPRAIAIHAEHAYVLEHAGLGKIRINVFE